MIETAGNFGLRNGHGSGMIRLVWKSSLRRGIEVRENESRIFGVSQGCERVRDGIARLVMPGLEVGCLGRTDAEHYPQHFKIGDLQGQNRVEAAATLLDEAEMEGSGVGDGLDVALRAEVGIRHRDGGKLPAAQTRDRLGKLEAGIEIGIFGTAAVRVYQLVSTVSCMRLVSRPIWLAPVALLLGRVRN